MLFPRVPAATLFMPSSGISARARITARLVQSTPTRSHMRSPPTMMNSVWAPEALRPEETGIKRPKKHRNRPMIMTTI